MKRKKHILMVQYVSLEKRDKVILAELWLIGIEKQWKIGYPSLALYMAG